MNFNKALLLISALAIALLYHTADASALKDNQGEQGAAEVENEAGNNLDALLDANEVAGVLHENESPRLARQFGFGRRGFGGGGFGGGGFGRRGFGGGFGGFGGRREIIRRRHFFG